MRLKSFLRNLFERKGVERELDGELQSILQMLVDEKVRAGLSPVEARREAMIEIGGMDQVREGVRSVRAGQRLDGISRQVRFAFRLLRKSPVFTAVAVFTLALGIGANAAMFTIVNAVLLRPLPYKSPAELVLLSSANDKRGYSGMPLPAGAYFDFRDDRNAFADLAAFSERAFTFSTKNDAISVPGARVTHNAFQLLGVSPSIGRAFSKDEDSPGAAKTVVVSYGFWQRYYGGHADISGETILLDSTQYSIIGVMPRSFAFPTKDTNLWVPLQLNESNPQWGTWGLQGIGRMRPGATLQGTTSALALGAQRLAKNLPFGDGWRFEVKGLMDSVVGEYRSSLRFLFGAVGLVLLIACVNVSSLLLARTRSRRKELAMRVALGSARTRIVMDLLIENCVLALVGGLAGVGAAYGVVAIVKTLLPVDFPRLDEIHVDLTVLAFTAIVSLTCGLVSGVVPAIRSSRINLLDALKGEDASTRARLVGGAGMVVVETALCVVIVVAAGLLVRSFERVMEVPMGFNPDGVVSMPVNLPAARYRPVDKRIAFERDLLLRLEPALKQGSVALSTSLPTKGTQMMESSFTIEGSAGLATIGQSLGIDVVTGNYFNVVGVPLLQGRLFNDTDIATAEKVVIVNQSLARKFPNSDAVGRRLKSSDDVSWYTIVGVAGDVKQYGLEEKTPMQSYLPFEQEPSMRFHVIARSQAESEATGLLLKTAVHELDPALPAADIVVLKNVVRESVAGRRLNAMLMSGFGLLAIILSTAGIYGVAEFVSARRKREVGIRIALGAGRLEILRLLLGQTFSAAVIGVAVGIVAVVAGSSYFESIVFGIPSTDPTALSTSVALILFVSLLAAYIPVRRALKLDTMRSLRAE